MLRVGVVDRQGAEVARNRCGEGQRPPAHAAVARHMHHDGIVRNPAAVRRLGGAAAEDDLLVGAQPNIAPDASRLTRLAASDSVWGADVAGAFTNASRTPVPAVTTTRTMTPSTTARRRQPGPCARSVRSCSLIAQLPPYGATAPHCSGQTGQPRPAVRSQLAGHHRELVSRCQTARRLPGVRRGDFAVVRRISLRWLSSRRSRLGPAEECAHCRGAGTHGT